MRENRVRNNFIITGVLFLIFILYTVLVMFVDVRAIGPQGSEVGFASVNKFFLDTIGGYHSLPYEISDVLGKIALAVVAAFAVVGLVQLIQRKSILKIDSSILVLGCYYVVVMACYVFFEVFIVNYRPVILEGSLEASYPSSHTVLVCCVMTTAIMQCIRLIKNTVIRNAAVIVSGLMIVVMIVSRLLSGVHWFSDIIGGILLSAALVWLYYSTVKYIYARQKKAK